MKTTQYPSSPKLLLPESDPLPQLHPSPILALPLELQLLIFRHLSYPDALALKHTSTHFYNLLNTNVRLKVAWLLERKERGLEWPQKMCVMKTDAAFCGNGEVREIMENRRAHGECAKGMGGCEVVVGGTCGGGRGFRKGRGMRMLWKRRVGRRGEGVVIWMVGLVVMSLIVNLWFMARLYLNHGH